MGGAYLCLLFTLFSLVQSINGKCLHDQESYLLRFRDGLSFRFRDGLSFRQRSEQLMTWNQNVDCCDWRGVECDVLGRVVSLELIDDYNVSIRNENWKTVFSLQYLEKLNLALIPSEPVPIPMELYNLTKLQYLNLSRSDFSGQIPIGLSKLNNLVTLDLSGFSRATTCNPYERCHRASGGLYGDYLGRGPLQVGIWFKPDDSKLEVSNPGGLKALFQNLTELREIYLDRVNVSAGGSDWFKAFSHMFELRVLSLSGCQLPGPIFPSLSNLSSLTNIHLDNNPLSTTVPEFFANLTSLRNLDLSACGLHGRFPRGIFQIATLESLKVSDNELLEGSFPQFLRYGSLKEIILKNTSFSGSMPADSISYLGALSVLDLSLCNFSGVVPATLANLSQLTELSLSNNQFSGPIPPLQNSQNLSVIDLSDNSFSGKLSSSLFTLPVLDTLDISNNHLDGWIEEFPNANSSSLELENIDLSLNSFTGKIPNWLWNLNLKRVDLSFNQFSGIQKPCTFPNSIKHLDLNSNMLKGEIFILPTAARYVDYSNNNLNSSIPSNIGYRFNPDFFDLSNNNISGSIPESMCNLTSLTVLDLSNNSLRGTIPKCLFEDGRIEVLKLSGNKLSGHIPDSFRDNCDLRTLDFSQNAFNGKMPLSLVKCESLQVVNVGGNYLEDHFPCVLMKGRSLSVVVLRSNRFYGEISCHWNEKGWTNLQILDVSYNNFSGTLPPQLFLNCRGMMVDDNSYSLPLGSHVYGYYKDSVTLVIKGENVELVNILSIYKTLDFSCNGFQGKLPKEIGELRGLFTLNLSNNALSETIPVSVGNLVELQSLDLSRNQLTGRIPSELANLTFLSVLNLSYNHLSGNIPNGRQLQTFSESSFLGNKGLCGFPLSSCGHGSNFSGSSSPARRPDEKEIDWGYVCAAVGFSMGLGIILLLNFLNPGWWQKFNALIIQFLILRVFGLQVQERQYRNPIRRL